MRNLALALAFLVVGCSSDDGGGKSATGGAGGTSSGGTGGSAGSPSGGSGGSTGGSAGVSSGGSAGVSSGGSGGTAGATATCPDPTNPMFGSCIESFLAGCYQPDTSGTCTSENGVTTWSDGSKFVPTGSTAGMYAPGASTPCIDLLVENGNITATKGSEVLKYEPDTSTGLGTITCPDGTSFTAMFDQVTAFNVCAGIDCPGG